MESAILKKPSGKAGHGQAVLLEPSAQECRGKVIQSNVLTVRRRSVFSLKNACCCYEKTMLKRMAVILFI
jgi:hypothetical protein